MSEAGYEFLRQNLGLRVLPARRPALIRAVTRVEQYPDHVAVPRHVAPDSDSTLEHLLFALKHEGINLAVLDQAVRQLDGGALVGALRAAPNGGYLRQLGFFWETFRNEQLQGLPEIGGPTWEIFDPTRYVTAPGYRDARWRVNWNGLGTTSYCVTVERTEAVMRGLDARILARTNDFAAKLGKAMLDRSLSWAYLSETEGSFAIEQETPTEDKARTFMQLLRQAHEQRDLTEDYLVELQNATISNALDKAAEFRSQQNWLMGPGRGAIAVTYVPPPPDLAVELMAELMAMGNTLPKEVDPVVAGSILSFGFVFIHPFMDGNGRLSRFLFHQALCRSGQLADGLLLPISVAMKRSEDEYLASLQTFSRPARELWNLKWIDEGQYDFAFNGAPAAYRFWDATPCVEFGFKMAEQALEHDLRQETEFLADYDAVIRKIDSAFDVRGSDLSTLVVTCFDNVGVVSKKRRKRFAGTVPEAVFDAIQAEVGAVLAARHKEHEEAKRFQRDRSIAARPAQFSADVEDGEPSTESLLLMSKDQIQAATFSFAPESDESKLGEQATDSTSRDDTPTG